MGKTDFLGRVAESQGPVASVEMIFLSDDLMQREALLAGELESDQVDMVVISPSLEQEDADLPEFLTSDNPSDKPENARLAVDSLWKRYFQHAHYVARAKGSSFLKAWIGFEVGLRNSIVVARAQRLDLDPDIYLVSPELSDPNYDASGLLSAWSSASWTATTSACSRATSVGSGLALASAASARVCCSSRLSAPTPEPRLAALRRRYSSIATALATVSRRVLG